MKAKRNAQKNEKHGGVIPRRGSKHALPQQHHTPKRAEGGIRSCMTRQRRPYSGFVEVLVGGEGEGEGDDLREGGEWVWVGSTGCARLDPSINLM